MQYCGRGAVLGGGAAQGKVAAPAINHSLLHSLRHRVIHVWSQSSSFSVGGSELKRERERVTKRKRQKERDSKRERGEQEEEQEQ